MSKPETRTIEVSALAEYAENDVLAEEVEMVLSLDVEIEEERDTDGDFLIIELPEPFYKSKTIEEIQLGGWTVWPDTDDLMEEVRQIADDWGYEIESDFDNVDTDDMPYIVIRKPDRQIEEELLQAYLDSVTRYS